MGQSKLTKFSKKPPPRKKSEAEIRREIRDTWEDWNKKQEPKKNRTN